MTPQIEKDVPPPRTPTPRIRRHGKRATYPFRQMEVGDSFLVPRDWPNGINASGIGNRDYAPMRFVQRNTPDGLRVWRVK